MCTVVISYYLVTTKFNFKGKNQYGYSLGEYVNKDRRKYQRMQEQAQSLETVMVSVCPSCIVDEYVDKYLYARLCEPCRLCNYM